MSFSVNLSKSILGHMEWHYHTQLVVCISGVLGNSETSLVPTRCLSLQGPDHCVGETEKNG